MVSQTVAERDRISVLPAEEFDRRQRREKASHPELWRLLDQVEDPEIPVISIWELGVLQDITLDGETVVVTITPTYSGCPAMDVIREDIAQALSAGGYARHRVQARLSPAWSSLWMDDAARQRLREYGIAPPAEGPMLPACPHCGSPNVKLVSEFGSTACKALFQCQACREPFDHFKNF